MAKLSLSLAASHRLSAVKSEHRPERRRKGRERDDAERREREETHGCGIDRFLPDEGHVSAVEGERERERRQREREIERVEKRGR